METCFTLSVALITQPIITCASNSLRIKTTVCMPPWYSVKDTSSLRTKKGYRKQIRNIGTALHPLIAFSSTVCFLFTPKHYRELFRLTDFWSLLFPLSLFFYLSFLTLCTLTLALDFVLSTSLLTQTILFEYYIPFHNLTVLSSPTHPGTLKCYSHLLLYA